jgi:hypothetical protein
LNVNNLLHSHGYVAVFLLVAAKSLGVPLPGETILITASVYAGTCHVKWRDNTVTAQDGKFEVAAKASYCYVASGPSNTLARSQFPARGRQVLNPLLKSTMATTQAPDRPKWGERYAFRGGAWSRAGLRALRESPRH